MIRADKAGLLSTSISKKRSMMTTDIVKGTDNATIISTDHIFHIS